MATTVLAIAGLGSALAGVGFAAYEVGRFRGFWEGYEVFEKPFRRTYRRAADYRRLWLYHRQKGSRLRRCLWEIRKALGGDSK